MKLRLASANPAAHIRRPARGSRGQALETVLRIGQLALVLWLAVIGAKWAAGALLRAGAALFALFA